jgi:uncharacterized protein YndB with AHSA1/START domain
VSIEDAARTVGLVTREVRTGARNGTPTRIAVARRTYATDRDDLWSAVTDPERIPRWFLPVSGDLRTGGRYQLEGNAGGVVERCEPPELFAVTWEYGPMLSWLQVTLRPDSDGTTLELVHEAPVDPDTWAQFGPGAVGVGWDLGLLGLQLHLASGAQVDATAALAFPTTPAGRDFLRVAATGWADAAVADGDDATAAHQAATRTVDFYTGTAEEPPGDE